MSAQPSPAVTGIRHADREIISRYSYTREGESKYKLFEFLEKQISVMSTVTSLLVATRSSNNNERTQAESQITARIQSDAQEFLSESLNVAGNPHSHIADAQSALMVSKTTVSKFWSPGFEQFVGPPLSHDTRAYVRAGLMHLLKIADNSRVRAACASVISRISSLEYPDQWPDVIQQCIQMLADPTDSKATLGGLVLFRELLLETVREEDFMNYGADVLAMLYSIAEPASNDGRRLLSLKCFHECITFLLMGDDDQMPQSESMAEAFIPQWCELFGRIMQEPETFTEVDVIKEIVDSVNELDSAFPKTLQPVLPASFDVTVRVIETQQGDYNSIVNRSSNDDDSSDRSENISNLSGLLMTVLQNKEARTASLTSDASVIRFVNLLLALAIIPPSIAEWWSQNFNEFVSADLGYDVSEFNSRENAALLIASIGNPLVSSHLLDLSSTAQGQDALLEALLFLLASSLAQVNVDDYLMSIDSKKLQVLLSALEFASVSLNKGNSDEIPPYALLLTARRALAASSVAKYGASYLPENIRYNLALHPFKAPYSDNESVRISQIRATVVSTALFPTEFKTHQTDLSSLIGSLIEDAEDDTPVVLTESFSAVIKSDYSIVATNSDVVNMIFALANKDTSDVDLNAQILDVVGEILDAVPSREVVSQIMQPVLATISRGAENNYEFSGDLYFALDLATAVFEHDGIELSSDEREQMLSSFYNVITNTEDPQILQAASFAYAASVRNINSGISPEAIQSVLRVAAQLLNPDLTDSAALASGKLVTAIIEQFSSELDESLLTELIDACARRLVTAKNALLVETLVIVFCESTLRNAPAVVDLLSASGMLEPVMKQWVPTFEVVRGADEIHKNVRAFQLLFDLHDPRLEATILPDEPIRESNQILTRRRAKNLKFTQIASPSKISKLLLKESAQAPKPSGSEDNKASNAIKGNSKYGIDPDDSEDDWDDELALDENGDTTDFRLYGLILDWFKRIVPDPKAIKWLNELNHDEQRFLMSFS